MTNKPNPAFKILTAPQLTHRDNCVDFEELVQYKHYMQYASTSSRYVLMLHWPWKVTFEERFVVLQII